MKNTIKIIILIIKVTLSIGLIFIFLNKFDFKDAFSRVSNLSLSMAVIAITLFICQLIIASKRLREIFLIMNQKISLNDAFVATYIGYFFSQTALSFLGGDALRIMHLSKKKDISLSTTTKAVALDRISGFFGQILLLIFTFPFLLPMLPSSGAKVFIELMAVLGVIAFTLVPFLANLSKFKIKQPVIALILDLASRTHQRIYSWKAMYSFLWLSFLMSLINCLIYYILCLGMHIQIDLFDIIILMPPVFFVSMLPISLSGWGVREGATVFALAILGVSPTDALAVSVSFGFLLLAISLPGILFWLKAARH
jgi:uncharacterized protein (TIRG00374 family)